MTSNTSRRAVVTGLAAVPVLAMPAHANATSALASPDPVFVALERVEQARAAFEAADEIVGAADERWRLVEKDFPQTLNLGLYVDNPVYTREDIAKAYGALAKVFRVADEDRFAIDAMVQNAGKRLDDLQARRAAERDRLGLTKALRDRTATHEALEREEHAALATVPTTFAGAAALTAFIRKTLEQEDHLEQLDAALCNVEAFLAGQGLA